MAFVKINKPQNLLNRAQSNGKKEAAVFNRMSKGTEVTGKNAFEEAAEYMKVKPRKKTFADMTPERRREVSSMGGKAVHAKCNANRWDREAAKAAGLKGLEVRRNKRKVGNK